LASLAKLQERDESIYYPAHGPSIEHPQKLLRGLILHRRQREAQILRELRSGRRLIEEMVPAIYKGIDPRLHPAAARSVLAHLIDLQNRGLAEREGEAWRLPGQAAQA
jgi:glyoxylase-like metal-dependent hydrolase (beta-lactamase superfamily II)